MAPLQADMGSPQPYALVARRAALWLLFLAPFFYLTYGFANWAAAQRESVGSVVFGWERHIPFVAWTIVPYWSINLFYAASLFLNADGRQVDRLAGRYLTAQCVAVACFLALPLAATFVRPETDGLPGLLFAVLGGFDRPFNQAPSLHIALLVIIWDHWRHRLSGTARWLWHLWCLLIGGSVLTTWQHHFIDVPTGALLGLFALWLFPREGELPTAAFRLSRDPKARRLAFRYGLAALSLLVGGAAGAFLSPGYLGLLWPSLSLAIVALGYAGAGPRVFQKRRDGSVSIASRVLLLPYRIGARLNIWVWTRRLTPAVQVAAGVSLGRFPSAAEANRCATVIDLAAEFERPAGVRCRWIAIPLMDLVAPGEQSRRQLAEAMRRIEDELPVLVCCALGFQRSADAVADWLLASGRARSVSAAERLIASAGRPVLLSRDRGAARTADEPT